MDDKVIEINKKAILKIVENQLDLFANELHKKNNQIKDLKIRVDELQKEVAHANKERYATAKALAEKIGVIRKRK